MSYFLLSSLLRIYPILFIFIYYELFRYFQTLMFGADLGDFQKYFMLEHHDVKKLSLNFTGLHFTIEVGGVRTSK